MTGIKDILGSAIGGVENSGSSLLDRLGDAVLGQSAQEETKNAPVIAPDATIIPVTQGRRSRRPDGQDPFHSDVPAPANESSGQTAQEETKNAPVIAPDATATPVTQDHRSNRPDGQDPFH